jgi:hypothetical protein
MAKSKHKRSRTERNDSMDLSNKSQQIAWRCVIEPCKRPLNHPAPPAQAAPFFVPHIASSGRM